MYEFTEEAQPHTSALSRLVYLFRVDSCSRGLQLYCYRTVVLDVYLHVGTKLAI